MSNREKNIKGGSSSITTLSSLVKQVRNEEPQNVSDIQEQTGIESKNAVSIIEKNNEEVGKDSVYTENNRLSELIEEINSKHYDNKVMIYCDRGLRDILSELRLKTGGKLTAGNLVSYLIEEFIKSHKEEITEIMNKGNKFI